MKEKSSGRSRMLAAVLFIGAAVSLFPMGEAERPVPMRRSAESLRGAGRPERVGDRLVYTTGTHSFELNLNNLSCLVIDTESGAYTIVSNAAFPSSRYRINDELTDVTYRDRGIGVEIAFGDGCLSLGISSEKPQKITWPSVVLEKETAVLIWPQYEGSYVPLSDSVWTDHLSSETWNTTEALYLPCWGIERGGRLLSYLFDNPFHNGIVFKETKNTVKMSFTHTFPGNADLSRPIVFRVYPDRDASPVTPALHFRRYLEDRGEPVTLEDKMKTAPAVAGLIGAPHAYLHGNGISARMIDALAANGLSRFVLTAGGIEDIEANPGLASYASEKGYLLGPYDGYDGVHDPDAPEWPTATFDRALYETGGIIRENGTPVRGFLGVGYYVSPAAVRPYFEKRVADNFRKASHSYYFLDCDAFGEFFEDHRPGRTVALSEDAAARVDRVRTVFETYGVPVGSEGGSYLFAGSLAVAQGVVFPTLGGDEDMRINEMSKYFLGRPMPAGEPENLFLQVPLKDRYVRLYGDPRFRLPLYEAVFHDSVISTSHAAPSSVKFSNIAETNALTEFFYQVPPLYHLNLNYLEKMKETIKTHYEAFEKTHSYSFRFPLEDFEFLSEDRTVQRTRFGNLMLTANFGDTDFAGGGTAVPAKSVLAVRTDTGESFVYRNPSIAGDTNAPEDIPGLVAALSDPDWKKREKAALGLSRIGVPAKAAVPALTANLRDGEWKVRAAAARALANMEDEAAPAVGHLITALRDEEWQVRRPAAYALAALGGKAKAAIPALIETLGDEEWHVRRPAAFALGSIGSRANGTVPALKALLRDPELQVRLAAEEALKKLRVH